MNTQKNIEEQMEQLHAEVSKIRGQMQNLDEQKTKLIAERRQKIYKHNQLLIEAQKQQWTSQGDKICPKCKKLKPIKTFSYLYLPRTTTIDGSSQQRNNVYEIIHLCAECKESILQPNNHAGYVARIPVEKRDNQFFIFSDGKFRSFKDVYPDIFTHLAIKEGIDLSSISESLLTIGKFLS